MDKQICKKMLAEIESDYANYAAIRNKIKAKEKVARRSKEPFLKYEKLIAEYDDLLLELSCRKKQILESMED